MAYFPDPAFESDELGADSVDANAVDVAPPAFNVDPLEDGLATAHFLAGKAEIEAAFADDPDPAKPLSDYDTPLVDVIGKAAGRISDPAHGKAFTQSAIEEAAAARKEIAEQRQKQLRLQEANDALEAVRTAALKIPGETGKTRLIDAGAAVIGGLAHHGLLTPEEAQARSRSWVEDYALQALKARPAKEQLDVIRSLAAGSNESNGSIFALIPQEERERLEREAELNRILESAKAADAKAESWNERLNKALNSPADALPPIDEIANDPELDPTDRQTLLTRYDDVTGQRASLQDALLRFDARKPFDPADAIDRKNADGIFLLLGGDETAAKSVLKRTGILPDAAVEKFPDVFGGGLTGSAATKPVQLASNDPTFVPDDLPVEADGRFLDQAERMRKQEALFGQGQSNQQAEAEVEPVRMAQNAQRGQSDANAGAESNEWKKHPFEELIEKNKTINDIIEREAKAAGVNPRWLKIIAYIESQGGKQKDKKGAKFIGLFQFGPPAWTDHGRGDRTDPVQNTRAAIREFKANRTLFMKKFGREPTLGEMYLMHQQGGEGTLAHMKNPNELAWVNLLPTAGNETEAKKRIRSNLETNLQADAYVNQLTSQEFMDYWLKKVEGGEGYGNWFMAFPAGRARPMEGTATDQNGIPVDGYSTPSRPNTNEQSRQGESMEFLGNSDTRTLSVGRNAIDADTILRNASRSSKWPR